MARGIGQPETIGELRAITIPIAERDVVISRELCKEILVALDSAGRFAHMVPLYVQRDFVSDEASEVHVRCREAVMRLRRAAMAQEVR